MEIKSKQLFDALRAMEGKPLVQSQVDTVNAVIAACAEYNVTDIHQFCYIIATGYHEANLEPVEEHGKGAGHDYGKHLDIGGGAGHRVPYSSPNQLYYGRGNISQITWLSNYRAFSKILGVDLVNHPELALDITIGAKIGVYGMRNGIFTGKRLSNYFTGTTNDPINARRIVNGLDCASLIAGYYQHILESQIA